jgi:hypothetical protein
LMLLGVFQCLADAAAGYTTTDWKEVGREGVDLFPIVDGQKNDLFAHDFSRHHILV